MELIDNRVNEYAEDFSEPTDDLLKEIETYTLNHHAHPNMLSGALQGKFLEIISKLISPKAILEIGTFTGYSALCLAKGLQPDGKLHTIELREDDVALSKSFFAKSSQASQIISYEGDALKIIPDMKEKWDLVFIDADKVNYINYYELTLPQLKSGGLLIADNVLFHGGVIAEKIKGKNAIAIHEFNQHVLADDRVQQVLVTLRDGLLLVRKN